LSVVVNDVHVVLAPGPISQSKCSSNPCEGSATCHEDPPNQSYKCTCSPKQTGKRCESGQYHNTRNALAVLLSQELSTAGLC